MVIVKIAIDITASGLFIHGRCFRVSLSNLARGGLFVYLSSVFKQESLLIFLSSPNKFPLYVVVFLLMFAISRSTV